MAGGHVSVPLGKEPLGYRRVDAPDGTWQLEIEPDEAQTIRLIFDLYTEPDRFLSQREIARQLTACRVPRWVDLRGAQHNARTKAPAGVWQPATVGQILRNELYVGRWKFGKQNNKRAVGKANPAAHLIEVEVPAIVDARTFAAAQRRKARNKVESRGNTKHEALLRRRLVCGCGVAMGVDSRKRDRGGPRRVYYLANHKDRAIHPTVTCQQNRSYRAEVIDGAAWSWVQRVYGNVDLVQEIGAAYQAQLGQGRARFEAEIKRLDNQLKAEERKLNVLIDLAFSGHSATVVAARQREIEQTLSDLTARRQRLQAQLASEAGAVDSRLFDFLYDLAAAVAFPGHSFEAKRALIEALHVRGTLTGGQLRLDSVLNDLVEPIVDWSAISPIQNVILLPEYSEL